MFRGLLSVAMFVAQGENKYFDNNFYEIQTSKVFYSILMTLTHIADLPY